MPKDKNYKCNLDRIDWKGTRAKVKGSNLSKPWFNPVTIIKHENLPRFF
jgi:hypothetical protein